MVYIIFRPLTQDQTAVASLCMEFIKQMREQNISRPVAWNIPPQLLNEGNSSLLTYLSRRGVESGDNLIFPGKSGKSHFSLSVNQVKHELYQFSGDFPLPVWQGYFPYGIDLNRPELLEYYTQKTDLLIEGIEELFYSTRQGIYRYPLLLQSTEYKRMQKTIKRNSSSPVFLLLEPAGLGDIRTCTQVLLQLSKEGPFKSLPETIPAGNIPPSELNDIRGMHLPHVQDCRNLSVQPFERNIIANMPGSVTLDDGETCVRFKKGSLRGILIDGKELLPQVESKEYCQEGGEIRRFTIDSSFSFTGEKERGLRTRISLESKNGNPPWIGIRDFYFQEDSKDLYVSLWWKANAIPDAASRISILEIPLGTMEDCRGFTYRDLQGDIHNIPLTPPAQGASSKTYVFAGSQFSFIFKERLPVTFDFTDSTERAVIRISPLNRRKNKYMVHFAPGGIYRPRSFICSSPVQERINFSLSTKRVQ